MYASAVARFMSANSRAVCGTVRSWASETVAAIRFQCGTEESAQNLAISVSSVLRVVLVIAPRLFTSLKAAVYAALVSAGGPAGRNWLPLVMVKGVTLPQ